jgi:hypothetical protein
MRAESQNSGLREPLLGNGLVSTFAATYRNTIMEELLEAMFHVWSKIEGKGQQEAKTQCLGA